MFGRNNLIDLTTDMDGSILEENPGMNMQENTGSPGKDQISCSRGCSVNFFPSHLLFHIDLCIFVIFC